jgi:HPr kinase/phosphorylase
VSGGAFDEVLSALGLQPLLAFPAAAATTLTAADIGFYHPRLPRAVQVVGSAADAARAAGIPLWPQTTPAGIVVPAGIDAECWRALAASHGIGCYASPWPAAVTLDRLRTALATRGACGEILHATLAQVCGLGVLLLGPSGAGKSELALELVARGHRLVADDAVELLHYAAACIAGGCPPTLYGFIELRGLGVIDLRAAYGETAVTPRARIDLVVRLDAGTDALTPDERLYGRRRTLRLLDTDLPEIVLPARLGHNAVMVETACRDHWLRLRGYVASAVFADAQTRRAAGEAA